MIKTSILTYLVALSLGAFTSMASSQAPADHPSQKEAPKSAMNKHAMMSEEPHHVLAMAYHQNLAVFAKALQQQTASAKPVNVVFARAAVAEMRRSFDQMKMHHQEHIQTMSSGMQSKMKGMMQPMATHQSELDTQLKSLQQEVELSAPDAKKLSTLAASVHTHLLAMNKMHAGCTMKMKM